MGTQILIFGAAGSPEVGPGNPPAAAPRPILTDEFGVVYTRLVADGPDPGTPLENVLWGNFSGPIYGLPVVNWPMLDMGGDVSVPMKAASAANYNADPSAPPSGLLATRKGPDWSLFVTPAVGIRASRSRGAEPAGKHVCTSLSITFAVAAADVATGGIVQLRDGATGAGTVLWERRLIVMDAAGGTLLVDLSDLAIVGSLNTAMTLEFSAAPGAASFQSVAFTGYTAGA